MQHAGMSHVPRFLLPLHILLCTKAWKRAGPSSSSPTAIAEVGTGWAAPWAWWGSLCRLTHHRIREPGTLPDPGSNPCQPPRLLCEMRLVRHRCGQGEGQEDGRASTLLLLPGLRAGLCPWHLQGRGATLAEEELGCCPQGTGGCNRGRIWGCSPGVSGLPSQARRAAVPGDAGPLSRSYGTRVLSSWGCCSWGLGLSSGGFRCRPGGCGAAVPGRSDPRGVSPPAPGMHRREQPGPAADGEAGWPFKKVEARKFSKVEKSFFSWKGRGGGGGGQE